MRSHVMRRAIRDIDRRYVECARRATRYAILLPPATCVPRAFPRDMRRGGATTGAQRV